MTLGVRCPHCESQFQLSEDLLGKSMRCPNPDCREIFEVREDRPAVPEPPAPIDLEPDLVAPIAAPTSGSVADFLPVFEIAAAPLPVMIYDAEVLPAAKSLPLPKKAAAILPAVKLPEATALPGPREVAWDAAAESLPVPKPPAPKLKPKPVDDTPVGGRRKRKGVPKALLALISVALFGTLVGVVVMLVLRGQQTEAKQVKEAEKLYAEGKFGEAAKRYEELQQEYPDGENTKKYEFFTKLSAAQNAIGSVAARENPAGPHQTFSEFLTEYGESPFAQPDTGFGSDIVQAGYKLANVFNDNAGDHVKEYRKDRAKLGELDLAQKSIQQGRELLPQLDRYRGSGGLDAGKAREQFDTTAGEVAKERTRLAVLAPFRNLGAGPTDERIAEFERALKSALLADDKEADSILALARAKLRGLVVFAPERRRAVAAIEGPPLAFLAPAVAGSPVAKSGTEETNDAVFGMALGVFYALDAHTGNPLWGRKLHATGADPKTMDLPLRIVLADGAIDWVLLPSNLDGKPALTAFRTRTGEAIWRQPLADPVLGQPALIGNQLFVPLQDPLGTVVHLDVVTGEQFGTLSIRQPIGGGLAALPGVRTDHGFLVVPGDARRIFVLEWGRLDADNRREPLTCVRSFATHHPKDSLRVEPMLTSGGDANASARLTLCEGDGPTSMKIRSFPLPPADELSKPQSEGDIELAAVAETPVAGWCWFAPISDGERVSVSTDAGVFMAFGINQVGNSDKGLFSLPGQPPAKEQDQVCRSQVIAQDEDAIWVLMGNRLVRLKVAVDGAKGYRLEPRGEARKLGEPLARSQVRPALNRAFVTYRPSAGGAVRMMAFDLETGSPAWERQLGASAIHPPIPLPNKDYLLLDAFGGAYRIRDTATRPEQETALVVETITPPADGSGGPTRAAVSADGRDVWTVRVESAGGGTKMKLQKYTDGVSVGVTSVSVVEQLAGAPLVLGSKLLVSLANGYVYRIGIADKAAGKGSVWRGTAVRGPSTCYLSPAGADEYLASDGGAGVNHFGWPADKEEAARIAGPWDGRGKISLPAIWYESGESKRLATGNDTGGICLFDRANALREPMRTWKGKADGPIPAGPVTQQFVWVGTRLVYTVKNESLVGLDPDADEPAWVARPPLPDTGELLGWYVDAGRLLISYQSGFVRTLNAKTGNALEETEADRPAADVAAVRFGPSRLLQANADGTVGPTAIIPLAGVK